MRTPRSRVLVVALLLLALLPGVGQAVPDELTQRLEQAQQQLAELDARVSLAVEEYNAAATRLERLQAQQQQTSGRVDALRGEVARLEDATAAFVRSMYMRGPATDLAIALDSTEVSTAGRDLAVVDRLSRQRHGELEQLGTRRTELDAARAELAAQVAAATDREEELARRRDEVEQTVADQQDEIAALQDEIAEIQAQEAAEAQRRREAAERERRAAEQTAAEQTVAEVESEAAEAEAAPPAPAAPTTEAAPPAPPAPEPAPAPPPGTRAGADAAVQAALSQLGKPYVYAAAGPDAYDCSGLTQWAWQHAGVTLPHSSRMQYAATTRVSRDQLQPGDLVFYGSPIHHVAMYLGGTRVIEAPYTGVNVRIREDGLLRSDIVGYGRV